MKKDKLIIGTYILTSMGLFVLAIDMWICGGEPFCRQGNSLSSKIANATITITIPNDNASNWSGPTNPNFDINFQGTSQTFVIPSDEAFGVNFDGH
jgi:hypothetical protein